MASLFTTQRALAFTGAVGLCVGLGSIFGLVAGLELSIVLCSALAGWLYLRRFDSGARVLADSQHHALTDALTGLGNRRKLMDDLHDALDHVRGGRSHTLVLFDLDGFKRYNDSFGHPAGDALLARLGARLVASVGVSGSAFRLGGDEFCVLVPDGHGADVAIAAAAIALTEEGEGFTVSASRGAVSLPAEADTPEQALQIADQRLYVEKDDRRRSSSEIETRQALAQTLQGRIPDGGSSLGGVQGMARAVGRALSLGGEELELTVRAAELHDIGMLSVPAVIVDKPGPLDPLERELIQQHTLVGERILSAAAALLPVGELVRSTHERWDGAGYPDGLLGEAIPRGARIVSVCVALQAMVSERPFRSARSLDDALEELRRHSGSQFDPGAAAVLVELVHSGAVTVSTDAGVLAGQMSDPSQGVASRSSSQQDAESRESGEAHRKGSRR